jgi:hypothetical protein
MNEANNFIPYFQLGIINNNPGVRVLEEVDVSPIILATMAVAMFETVMLSVEERNQNQFEEAFRHCFELLMDTRHEYPFTKTIDPDNYEQQ